jgi:hypothetical protein
VARRKRPPTPKPGSDNLNGYQFARWLIRQWLSPRGRRNLKSLLRFLVLWFMILAFALLAICLLIAKAAEWSGVSMITLGGVVAALTGLLGVFFKTRK